MSATFIQPLGDVTPGQRIVLARPDFTDVEGSFIVESLTPVDKDRVHLIANRVGEGEPQRLDRVFPGDASVGVVPPERRAMG